jgi:hypothetical protein
MEGNSKLEKEEEIVDTDNLNFNSADVKIKETVLDITNSFRNSLTSALPDHTKALKTSKLIAHEKQQQLSLRVKRGQLVEEIELKSINNDKDKITGIDGDGDREESQLNGKGLSAMVCIVLKLN